MLTVAVGTAGYAYPAWAGGFYPAGLAADAWLAHYAEHFPAVEINSTFYRAPTAAQMDKMRLRVPRAFRFSVKLPRSASHDADVGELPAFHAALEPLRAAGQLAAVLVQVPEGFRNTNLNRAWLIRIRELLPGLPLFVEFRHNSWDVASLPDWAARHGYGVVSVGVPDLPQLFASGLRRTGQHLYARLHSQNVANWYAGGPARYDYDFPPSLLDQWAAWLGAAAAEGAETAAVYFNNCVSTQAVDNAKRMMAALSGVPGVAVARPPAPTRRTLFDGVEG